MRKCTSYKPMIHPGHRGSSRRSRTRRQRLGGDEDQEGNYRYRTQGDATHPEAHRSSRPMHILPVPREHEPFAMQPWETCPSPPHLLPFVTEPKNLQVKCSFASVFCAVPYSTMSTTCLQNRRQQRLHEKPAASWLNSRILRAYALEDRRAMSHTITFLCAAVLGGFLGTLAQYPLPAPGGNHSEPSRTMRTAGTPDRVAASEMYRGEHNKDARKSPTARGEMPTPVSMAEGSTPTTRTPRTSLITRFTSNKGGSRTSTTAQAKREQPEPPRSPSTTSRTKWPTTRTTRTSPTTRSSPISGEDRGSSTRRASKTGRPRPAPLTRPTPTPTNAESDERHQNRLGKIKHTNQHTQQGATRMTMTTERRATTAEQHASDATSEDQGDETSWMAVSNTNPPTRGTTRMGPPTTTTTSIPPPPPPQLQEADMPLATTPAAGDAPQHGLPTRHHVGVGRRSVATNLPRGSTRSSGNSQCRSSSTVPLGLVHLC